jgi:hypothetical protein
LLACFGGIIGDLTAAADLDLAFCASGNGLRLGYSSTGHSSSIGEGVGRWSRRLLYGIPRHILSLLESKCQKVIFQIIPEGLKNGSMRVALICQEI